jgi:hypothetical protein
LRLLMVAAVAAPTVTSASPAGFQALEARRSDALAAYDRQTVDELFDDQLVFVFPNGRIAHKAERLAGMTAPSGAAPLTSHNDNVEVQFEDKTMAVVLVRSTWRQGDVVQGRPYLATHIWIRRPAGWRLIAAQVAQVTAP